jgi:hypothetical protein
MTSTRYLLILMRALVGCMWTGTAAAVALSVDRVRLIALSPLLSDPLVLALALGIATAAGITSLAIRVNMLLAQDPTRPMVKPWLFVIAHIGGAYLAAVVALLLASMSKQEADAALLAVLLLSFAGSRVVEGLAEKYMAVVRILPPAPPAPGPAQ